MSSLLLPEMFTEDQVAERFGVSLRCIRERARAKKLGRSIGRVRWFTPEEAVALMGSSTCLDYANGRAPRSGTSVGASTDKAFMQAQKRQTKRVLADLRTNLKSGSPERPAKSVTPLRSEKQRSLLRVSPLASIVCVGDRAVVRCHRRPASYRDPPTWLGHITKTDEWLTMPRCIRACSTCFARRDLDWARVPVAQPHRLLSLAPADMPGSRSCLHATHGAPLLCYMAGRRGRVNSRDYGGWRVARR